MRGSVVFGVRAHAEDWHAVMAMVLGGRDVYIVDHNGCLYPLELRHVTTGENGMTRLLRLVKTGRSKRRARWSDASLAHDAAEAPLAGSHPAGHRAGAPRRRSRARVPLTRRERRSGGASARGR